LVIGRLVAHRDGFGFVVPEEAVANMAGDLFLPPNALGDAMHGDRVAARIEMRGVTGRFEGRLVKILKRAHPTIVGLFRGGAKHGHGNERWDRVIPFDPRVGEIVIPPAEVPAQVTERLRTEGSGTLDGKAVNVELTRFPRGGVTAAGRVVEVLGRPGDLGVDTEIIIRKHHLPCEFPEEVLEETLAVPQEVTHAESDAGGGRRDFRALPIVTIDGETAKDFDDAVYVERLHGNGYALQVHIADVAHYVRRGSALDREARLRGTSVYFPERAVPMLPEALSNGICSLNPQVDRLVMSALMEFDAHGAMQRAQFTPGIIRSAERMTYTSVNKVLEGDQEMIRKYSGLAGRFQLMKELALMLNARRNRRGSIDFDLPEPVIEFDPQGRMQSITRSERNIAHRIIEEFMLAANEAVAAYLEGRGIASLHRVHEKPDPKKVLEFEELARAFGYSLGVADLAVRKVTVKHGKPQGHARFHRPGERHPGRPMEVLLPADEIDIRPQHYQDLVRKIAGKPEERILSYLMLRSLKQARYAADPLGHFALGAAQYTHFTSPIRRYPDLVVHRALKWALENGPAKRGHEPWRKDRTDAPTGKPGPYPMAELEEIAAESSDAERRADGAERELMDWKTAQFMEQHLGEEYDALIISVLKFGFFVELMEVFVEGLVPVSAVEEFAGERVFFRETDRAFIAARGKQAFHLGDRVRVRAERIEPMLRRVEFALVEAGD
jgi:ribonuclease R